MPELKGLKIHAQFSHAILHQNKTIEIRGCRSHHRGWVEILPCRQNVRAGRANLVRCIKFTSETWLKYQPMHQSVDSWSQISSVYKKGVFGYVFEHVEVYPNAIPYVHPRGAQIWVKITVL